MKQFLQGVLLLLLSFHAQAQPATTQSGKSLLWRISGNGLQQPSYLFGTAHLICPADYMWTNNMQAAFDSSAELCLEMNITDQAELGKYMVGITDVSGKKLEQYFTPKDYKEVATYFKDSLHLDIGQFAQLKPVALASIIEMKSLECAIPASYEQRLIAAAKEKGKLLGGLEDATETLEIVSHISADSIIAGLVSMARDNRENIEYTRQIINAYMQQDISTISTLARSQLHEQAAVLLDDRNSRWIARMGEKMKQRKVFFAVGAGHLADEKGVISLLRAAGYKVEAIN